MASNRTLIHAVIGAVVGVVLSFIPFSTVVGGAVAGFLEGPDDRAGATVGALSGVISFLPVAAFGVFILGFLGFGMGIAAAPFEGFAVAAFVVLAFALIVFLYTVGLSLLGGYLGAYLAREYPGKHRSARRSLGMAADSRSDRAASRSGPVPGSRGRSADRYPADDRSVGRVSDDQWGDNRARGGNAERERDRDRDRDPFDTDSTFPGADRRREDRERDRESEPERERDRERERDE